MIYGFQYIRNDGENFFEGNATDSRTLFYSHALTTIRMHSPVFASAHHYSHALTIHMHSLNKHGVAV